MPRNLPALTLVPIPLHPHKLKERGFNQAELLAQGFSQITRYPLLAQGLVRVKDTVPLFNLSPEQRQATLNQALQVGESLKKIRAKRPILLVDDIYTTGTTALEAQKVLQAQGFIVAGIVAIASPRFSKK
jgi:predicted amidophosphoribosyltransferase